MFTFSSTNLALLLVVLIPAASREVEDSDLDEAEDEDEDEDEEEEETVSADEVLEEVDMVVETENSTHTVDRSDEEWVREAVLDVAYSLRAHKFNDFDRRYFQEAVEGSGQYKRFPEPPLRYLHWEVSRHCDRGFYPCLEYLQSVVLKAELVRSLDTNTVMNQRRWEFPRNAQSIERLDEECRRLRARDWRDADPFKGPLERFQWRVSASYYMCSFTMQNLSALSMFGEPCDNFASCLDGRLPFNEDPRADDSVPYQCARYSFCPEVCCPARRVTALAECQDLEDNPCRGQTERQCTLDRASNPDWLSMALHQWNVSCHCESGYEWSSMFGACVDVDECSAGAHDCAPLLQTCLNLEGRYACACAWGYVNSSGVCVLSGVLSSAMTSLHRHYHALPTPPTRPFSLSRFLFEWTVGLFVAKAASNPATATDGPALDTNNTDDLINFNTDE